LPEFNETLWLRGVDEVIRYYFRRLGKNERGVALIEFAIVALLLFTLIFGIIEFGWIFFSWITLTGAVREGARIAVLKDADDEEVKDAVENHALTFDIDRANITITPQNNNGGESTVTVKATGDLPLLVGMFLNNNTLTLTAEGTMRQE